ncbi:DUF6193 family natural product biosynthesis protein [Streptomyces sp. NBC_00893]|uniref:DUF6193 family natural product biosynthesis protein n=1 Tax=Streptomyces sp. NBC_00893 TaxID=2975862 RepID=UPI00224FC671|nr:DUF6193 family natural product biosynthesis protein [Streptomyces sp. NBC_00893]MCX4845252.1 DUF6193 family natural product biosynthesis protein [Streptomyces sp. NBC_00893]
MGMINFDLYPEIQDAGSLSSAMTEAADRVGLDLVGVCSQSEVGSGVISTAQVDSSRGKVLAWLDESTRTFFVGVQEGRFVWAEGATDDLADLVAASVAWRDGMSVGEFAENFPFMTLTRLAKAREAGDPVPAQWDWLLNSEIFEEERPLVEAAHAEYRFRRLFPNLSHGTLRLSTNLGVQGSREIHISPLGAGRYRVEDTSVSGSSFDAGSLMETVVAAAEFLDRGPNSE